MLAEGTELSPAPEPQADAPANETPAAGDPPAQPAPASEPVTQEEPEEAELPKGVQKKIQKEIDKAVKARADAERFRDELAAKLQDTAPAQQTPEPPAVADPQAPTAKPKPELANYADYDEFIEALTDWKTDQKIEAREQAHAEAAAKRAREDAARTAQGLWEQRVDEIKTKHPDYDTVLADARIPITPAIREALWTSDAGPAMAYHLAKHPDECKRIAALPPIAAVRELGKLEATLGATTPRPSKPAGKETPLPKPPATVPAGSAPAAVDLDTCDMRTFKREMGKILTA